jgi:hypothetical protein
MFETSFIERPSSLIESIDDFAVLQKIVRADKHGSLLASKVKINVSLEKESYTDVRVVMEMIGRSSTIYEFSDVNNYSVRNRDEWDQLKSAMMTAPGTAPRMHVLSEISVSPEDFEEMRLLLCSAGSLLLVVPAEDLQPSGDQTKASVLH